MSVRVRGSFHGGALSNSAILFVLVSWLLALGPLARAGDIDSAKRKLETAKSDLSSRSWDAASKDVKDAEEFLDGLPESDRAPIQKELDSIKKQVDAGLGEYQSKEIPRKATSDLDSAADEINSNPDSALGNAQRTIDLLGGADAKKYVDPAQLKKLQDRAVSLQKMAAGKVAGNKIAMAAPWLKRLDDAMAAGPFKDARTNEDLYRVTQELNSNMSQVRGALAGLPADEPRVKAINDKLTAYARQIDAASGGAQGKQAGEQLAHMWKNQQEYFAGWDKEASAPTWEGYAHKNSDSMDALLMPKTVELLTRLSAWFGDSFVKETSESYKDEPTVKATLGEAHQAYDTAAAKLNKAFNGVLAEAEKAPTPTDDSVRGRAGSLADRADTWFKGTPFHDPNVARAKSLKDKWDGAIGGAAQAKDDLLKKLTEQAAAAWPKMIADLKPVDGFTPDSADSFKGKLIHLTGPNRAGWDFNADYDFARKINGLPVAGKFDPNVRAAVESIKSQLTDSVPDDNWDVYAVVEGPGKIQERTTATGKVTIDGTQVGTVSQEAVRSIDCTVVRVVAVHAGPIAVSPQGVVDASGAVKPTGAASLVAEASGGFSIIKLLEHLVEFLICLAAAAVVVMSSRRALVPVGTGATGGAGRPAVGPLSGDLLGYLGLVFTGMGLLWLVSRLIIGDLFPALSLALSGLCIAADWLQGRSIFPAAASGKLKQMALPIAGATVLFGFLHIFLASWYFF